ncbi:MAG: sigma factor [Desulfotomaculales bacterium]
MFNPSPCYKTNAAGVIFIAGVAGEGWPVTTAEFEALFESCYPLFYRRLHYLLGERTAAGDLIQEIFLKLYRQPPLDTENTGGWLLRVAANLAFMGEEVLVFHTRLSGLGVKDARRRAGEVQKPVVLAGGFFRPPRRVKRVDRRWKGGVIFTLFF